MLKFSIKEDIAYDMIIYLEGISMGLLLWLYFKHFVVEDMQQPLEQTHDRSPSWGTIDRDQFEYVSSVDEEEEDTSILVNTNDGAMSMSAEFESQHHEGD